MARRPQILRLKWVLFDPTRLFTFLARSLAPARYLDPLIWPALILAIIIVIFSWNDLVGARERQFAGFDIVFHVLLGMMTNNLVSKITQGTVIVYKGGRVPEFGIRLHFKFYPRFYIPVGAVRLLPFRAQRACYAAPLKARLAVFVVGIMLWAALRRSNAGAADAALVLAIMAAIGFAISANPLFRFNGYRWITAYFEQPRLREDGLRILRLALTGKPIPPVMGRLRVWALAIYALLSVLFTAGVVLLVLAILAYILEERFSGTGVFLVSVILVMVLHSMLRLVSSWKARIAGSSGRAGFRMATDSDAPARTIGAGNRNRLTSGGWR